MGEEEEGDEDDDVVADAVVVGDNVSPYICLLRPPRERDFLFEGSGHNGMETRGNEGS